MSTRLAILLCAAGTLVHAQSSSPATAAARTQAELAAAVALPAGMLGQGAWRFEVVPGWAKLPAGVTLGPTHGGVGVDAAGNIYVSSDGPQGILVFDARGNFLRGLAGDLGKVHGFMIRQEGGREFIYAARAGDAEVVKATLDGKVEWKIGVPQESGLYGQPTDATKKPVVFRPTGVTVGPDNRIYIADGYGASVVHIFSPDRKYVRTFGSRGKEDGQFTTCHGISLDTRFGTPRLLIADRENQRLVHHDLEGKFLAVVARDLRRPCSMSILGDHVAVAELQGRVVVLDKAGKIVTTLGDNPDQQQWAKFQTAPELWKDGIFIAPHGVAFDRSGNLFVQDWNFTGRFTKLQRAR